MQQTIKINKFNYFNLRESSVEVLKIIDKFGFLTSEQIMKLLNLCPRTTYRLLKRLLQKQLITFRKTKWNNLRFYHLRVAGTKLIENSLGYIRFPSWNQINHENTIIDFIVSNKLEFNDYWVAREIKKKLQSLIIPDLIITNSEINKLVYQNQTIIVSPKTAIEFELTWKSSTRYNTIFDFYQLEIKNNIFEEIIYFCKPFVAEKLTKFLKKNPLKNKVQIIELKTIKKGV